MRCARWSVGDKVTALTNGGGYAEYCTVDAQHCLPVPKGIALTDAAGLPETFFTVWSNIFMGAGLKAGETFLVHGGAGGIGTTAIQLGKAFGAKVIATDSPEDRCGICRDLGADRVIDYRQEDFVEIVRKDGGANVILDIVGGPNIEHNFKAANHDCRIVQLAFALGSKVEINLMPVMLKRLTYTGSTLRTRPAAFKTRIAEELEAEGLAADRERPHPRGNPSHFPACRSGPGPRRHGKRRARRENPAGPRRLGVICKRESCLQPQTR